MRFRVIVEQDEDGYYIASCPNLPGCISDGGTRAEALENMKDAMVGYLTSVIKNGDPLPTPISEEFVDVDLGKIEGAA